MRSKWVGTVFSVFISIFAADAHSLEVGAAFDSIKPGQWVRYDVEEEGGMFSTHTYCIEAIEGEDAVVVYRTSQFHDGAITTNFQIRIPLELFEKYCQSNHKFVWEGHGPAETVTEEFGEGEMELSVFKKTREIPAEYGGGAVDATHYRNRDIPITNLFRVTTSNPQGKMTRELTEFGQEIDEDVYPEILPDDPTDMTAIFLPILQQAMAKK